MESVRRRIILLQSAPALFFGILITQLDEEKFPAETYSFAGFSFLTVLSCAFLSMIYVLIIAQRAGDYVDCCRREVEQRVGRALLVLVSCIVCVLIVILFGVFNARARYNQTQEKAKIQEAAQASAGLASAAPVPALPAQGKVVPPVDSAVQRDPQRPVAPLDGQGLHVNYQVRETTMIERSGELTFKGNPMTLLGGKVEVGQKAPDFSLITNKLGRATLADSAGKVRIISVVPSLDTGICDAQTRKFNEAASELGDGIVILTVSADLPFAQARWCGAAGVDRVETLSDHFDLAFGNAYGVHVKELRLDSRAVFVVDAKDVVTYAQYVGEIAEHPDYDGALAAAKAALG